MIRAVLLATLALGCGVKAAPRPPARPDAAAAEKPAAEGATCGACGTGAAPAPRGP